MKIIINNQEIDTKQPLTILDKDDKPIYKGFILMMGFPVNVNGFDSLAIVLTKNEA